MQTWLRRLDLRAAIPTLPALAKLQAADRAGGFRPLPLVIVALLILLAAGGAWWAGTHGESLEAAAAQADLWRSTLWRTLTGTDGSRRSAVSDAPNSASADATPPTTASQALDVSPVTSPSVSPMPQSEAASPGNVVAAAPTPSASPAQSASGTTRPSSTDTAAPPPGRRARIELTADNVEVTPDETVARVVVRRSRWMRGDATFTWWTESGTAKPGRDFIPVTAHTQTLGSGKSTGTLFIPLLADATRRDPRSFYVVIDVGGDDAAVGPRTLTQVTLTGSD